MIQTKYDLNAIISAASDYEDGETGINACIQYYCENNGIDEDIMELAQSLAFTNGALSAGIPLSVIEGKTSLTDHFSKEYIDLMIGRTKEN